MPISENDPGLAETRFRQLDIVSRSQLIDARLDDHAIGRAVRRGDWQRVLPGIYKLATGTPGLEQRRIAAALYVGDKAQLTGSATLLFYGFTSPLASDRIHTLVPHDSHRRSAGFVVVQRAVALDPKARDVGLYRVTSPARAVVDACRQLSERQQVRAIVAEAVQRSMVSVDALHREINRANRSRTSIVRRALLEVAAGVRSAPEAALRDIVLASTVLPKVLWNPLLESRGKRLPTPDGWISDGAIALEVDSKTYHEPDAAWDRTLDRSNAFTELGATVVHATPTQISTDPAGVLRRIENAYRARAGLTAPITVVEGTPLWRKSA